MASIGKLFFKFHLIWATVIKDSQTNIKTTDHDRKKRSRAIEKQKFGDYSDAKVVSNILYEPDHLCSLNFRPASDDTLFVGFRFSLNNIFF